VWSAATSPARSVVDALQAGTQLEQVELAARQALQRGMTTLGGCGRRAGTIGSEYAGS